MIWTEKKHFLMSPLNSNKLKNFSLYNKSKQCYNHSSQMFSFLFFFFNVCTVYLKKCSFFLSFSFFFLQMLCSTMFKFLLFFSFPSFFHCPVRFCFCFHHFFFFFFFFHNKIAHSMSLFFPTLYLPLSVLTLIL